MQAGIYVDQNSVQKRPIKDSNQYIKSTHQRQLHCFSNQTEATTVADIQFRALMLVAARTLHFEWPDVDRGLSVVLRSKRVPFWFI